MSTQAPVLNGGQAGKFAAALVAAARPAALVLAAVLMLPVAAAAADRGPPEVASALAERLRLGALPQSASPAMLDAVRRFYAARDHRPAWTGESRPESVLAALQAQLAAAAGEGLRPADYLLQHTDAGGAELDRELETSLVLARYARDLSAGRVSPRQVDPELFVSAGETDPAALLAALAADQDPAARLRRMAPASAYYVRLRRMLAEHRRIAAAGGWPQVSPGGKLEPGMLDARVAELRARLSVTDHVATVPPADPAHFDASLALAVSAFQARHGLDPDGVVGPRTLAALNVSVEQRIEQIILNMERWRWLPDEPGERHVLVNLAGFELHVHDHGAELLRMRVVIGKTYRRSPVFSARITHLDVNPTWTVPQRIAVQDLLPKARADAGFFAANGYTVYDGHGDGARAVAPASIDWRSINGRGFRYRLVQAPGPRNALGRFKFVMPNPHDVYLHDTPSRELFARSERLFSSGCIRLQRPLELAEYVLAGDSQWNRARLLATVETGKLTRVRLPQPLPVHLVYATAWPGEGGSAQFRADVYGRDELLRRALMQ